MWVEEDGHATPRRWTISTNFWELSSSTFKGDCHSTHRFSFWTISSMFRLRRRTNSWKVYQSMFTAKFVNSEILGNKNLDNIHCQFVRKSQCTNHFIVLPSYKATHTQRFDYWLSPLDGVSRFKLKRILFAFPIGDRFSNQTNEESNAALHRWRPQEDYCTFRFKRMGNKF